MKEYIKKLTLNKLDKRKLDKDIKKVGGGGGIPDAPVNGKQYARKDGDWSEVIQGGDGWHYVRLKTSDYDVENHRFVVDAGEGNEMEDIEAYGSVILSEVHTTNHSISFWANKGLSAAGGAYGSIPLNASAKSIVFAARFSNALMARRSDGQGEFLKYGDITYGMTSASTVVDCILSTRATPGPNCYYWNDKPRYFSIVFREGAELDRGEIVVKYKLHLK